MSKKKTAGAVFWCLFLTGVLMSLLNGGVLVLLLWVDNTFFGEKMPLTLFYLLQIFLFLSLLRLTPLAGYHAAEHQTVNAIEQGEPLTVERVLAMSRFHPRCGTNLMALFITADLMLRFGSPLFPIWGGVALLTIGFILFLVWRPLGKFLQLAFTTRPPTKKQVLSGVHAGEELLTLYHRCPDHSASFLQKVWNMGIVQIIVGWAVGFYPFLYLIDWVWRVWDL